MSLEIFFDNLKLENEIMLIKLKVIWILLVISANGQVLLYNTENGEAIEKADCVYYVSNDGEEISYCQRLGASLSLNRSQNDCENEGEKKYFRDLLREEIPPDIILQWSSSVEMVDLYARVFSNRSLIDDDQFLCKCIIIGTFGKSCQYRLTHQTKKFSETINKQFERKKETDDDSWNTQRYGKILCYETLLCPSSPLCLDWREICDGIQRCKFGIDEENCDKLEFNECEDDEFRCGNGMCIPEQFWLDGNFSLNHKE